MTDIPLSVQFDIIHKQLVIESYAHFMDDDISMFDANPRQLFTKEEIWMMKPRQAIFSSHYYHGNPWKGTDINPIENLRFDTTQDEILFGIYYRKVEPPNISQASSKAQELFYSNPGCIVWIIPETFHCICKHRKSTIDMGDADISFDEENPRLVKVGDNVMDCVYAMKSICVQEQYMDVIEHIKDYVEVFSEKLY